MEMSRSGSATFAGFANPARCADCPAAQAMRAQDERKESIFRQSVEAEKNKEDLFEKKFAEALRKAKDAPEGKPLREFDLD